MEHQTYFQSYEPYFWQWEEGGEVSSIPGGSTIAYRAYAMEVLLTFAPQGIPPFGSLLLVLAATNPNGRDAIGEIVNLPFLGPPTRPVAKWPDGMGEMLDLPYLHDADDTILASAEAFLKLLADLPQPYKEGHRRMLLLQTLFEGCHNRLSATKAQGVLASYQTAVAPPKPFDQRVFQRDFRTIAVMAGKFSNAEAVLAAVANLPELPDEISLPDASNPDVPPAPDLVQQLTEHHQTFHVGALIRSLWGGLRIPARAALPSQQPLGGVSDLTNQGEYDKLLVSEFANDDLVLLSRLANREALYLRREVPPEREQLRRVVLIDTSLKTWGTPRAVAFAAALAIAQHPNTNVACAAFAIGATCQPLALDTHDAVIDSLQVFDASLHAADGLAAFFRENAAGSALREVIVVTSADALRLPAMQRALHDHQARVSYWLCADTTGGLDVYRRQQRSRKHLQRLQLPLSDLWKNPPKPKPADAPKHESPGFYPLLFPGSSGTRQLLTTADGAVFKLTNQKSLLRHADPGVAPDKRGWEMLHENLPFAAGEFEMGKLPTGEYVLLMFDPQNREIMLLNVTTGARTRVPFGPGRDQVDRRWLFVDDNFHFVNHREAWRISPDGQITATAPPDYRKFTDWEERRQSIAKQYAYAKQVFKNVNEVFIDQQNNLGLNVHRLRLNRGEHIKLDTLPAKADTKPHRATRVREGEFAFADGSAVLVNPLGMITLRSSDPSIPDIFVPSVLGASLGVATAGYFAGNGYYRLSYSLEQQPFISARDFFARFIQPFITHVQTHGTHD